MCRSGNLKRKKVTFREETFREFPSQEMSTMGTRTQGLAFGNETIATTLIADCKLSNTGSRERAVGKYRE